MPADLVVMERGAVYRYRFALSAPSGMALMSTYRPRAFVSVPLFPRSHPVL